LLQVLCDDNEEGQSVVPNRLLQLYTVHSMCGPPQRAQPTTAVACRSTVCTAHYRDGELASLKIQLPTPVLHIE
jgi:hypothetical protein